VIIGAGFGGLHAAAELKHAEVDVTLVDRHNFHTFQPLLYQVATAGLAASDVAYPVRGIFRRQSNLAFLQGKVTGVDWDAQLLQLEAEEPLAFDYLIVAAGATTNTFGIDGVDDYGFPLYNLADAIRLRNHALDCFEAADRDPTLLDDGALTFVVVGGGPTGVEVAGALSELFAMVLRKDFPRLDTHRWRVVLVEMRDELLAPFSPPSRRHARQALEQRGVEVRVDTAVERIAATRVRFHGGEELAAHTLVWAAGVKPNPLAAVVDVPLAASGRIEVGTDLRIDGQPAFAIGDVAAIPAHRSPRHGSDVLPQLAPVAMQSGRHAARQVVRLLEGKRTKPFRYVNKGTMATIGRRSAVAELPLHIKLSGTPAWFAWLGLHLVFLAGFRNRLSVFLNWSWNYLTWDRGPRLIIRSEPPPPRSSSQDSTQ